MREIRAGEQADNLFSAQLADIGEQRRKAGNAAAVILNALLRLREGLTGGCGIDQHKRITVLDHMAQVIREHKLTVVLIVDWEVSKVSLESPV